MSEITLPESVPLITLGQCNLFPHGLLPLYLFEPRYQQMVDYALEQGRILCVSTRLPDAAEDDDDAVFPYSTAGLVRACVRGEDGTSNLILQGLHRVRFGDWVQKEPFRIVKAEPIHAVDPDPDRTERLQQQLRETVAGMDTDSQIMQQLEATSSAEVMADILAYHLIPDPYTRQPLLEMESISDRLDFLLKSLASV
ncbi:MAG: Lon protease-like protein [Verrucomicrobiales bacterium]|jgi:Lon protease-like protein